MKTLLFVLAFFLGVEICCAQNAAVCNLQYNENAPVYVPGEIYLRPNGENRSVVKLPTVVHILYYYPHHNLTVEEVQSLLDEVNKDFRRLNTDTVDTPDAFKPVAADMEIEFELATVDPWGNPTSGVTHTEVSFGFWYLQDEPSGENLMKYDSTGGKSAWDTEHYVNIWLIGSSDLILDGISTLPHSHGKPYDGVVATMNSFYLERILTHNLGHYLGLRHLGYSYGWPNGCSTNPGGPDGLEDTPNQLESTIIMSSALCPNFPQTDICSPDFPGIMFMNFMDGTLPTCTNLFTQQQAGVMRMVLDSVRFSLLETVSGIGEVTAKPEFKTYPNPAGDLLQVQYTEPVSEPRHYIIFDHFGRQVFYQKSAIQGVVSDKLDISNLTCGFYWLKIQIGQQFQTAKLVRQ